MCMARKEKTKRDFHSTKYYVNALDKETVRTNHPLQRSSGQWSEEYRDGLIGTILKNEDIPYIVICEQILKDSVRNYLIDGIQRITTIYNYSKNVFKLGNKVENPLVEYEVIKTDENGNNLRDEDGELIRESVVCDIRGKYYRDLPKELQEQFDEYQVMEVKHLNCSDERIGYEIRRYNHAKNMGASQGGITYLNSNIAEKIKGITTHTFFKDLGNFTKTERKNDTFSRIILESIMATYFLDEWKSPLKDICSFLNSNITDNMICNFMEEMNALSNALTDDTSKIFTSKNSFLWFATYHKFCKYGLDTKKFVSFMKEFNETLCSKEWNGETFTELNKVSTKKKTLIIKKLELMEDFMKEYLHIKDVTPESFVAEMVDLPVETVKEEMDCYEETLDGLESNTIRDGSKLLEVANRLSLLAMVAYSYKNDVDLDDWMEDYAAKNNMFYPDQRKNFLHMLNSLNTYNQRAVVA